MLDHVATPLDPTTVAAVLDALPGPVIAVDGDSAVMAANEPARLLLPGLRVGDPLVLALRAPDVLDAVSRARGAGTRETVMWRDRVPVERSFEITVAPLLPHHRDGALVLALRDRTEARRLERMRVEFIADASHELRTPLASLLGFIETLQGPARDDAPARGRFLGIMAEQGRRMARLVDDLLSLSRIEQHLHVRPSAAVDLDAVVRHVADTLTPLAEEVAVTLTVTSPGPLLVTGDRDELIRVAENLIENAIKYGTSGPGHPRVEVGIERSGREALLVVRDEGPGIAPHHLPRLTERFYRVDAGESRSKGGTGLGLALVKHVLARHRGRLSVESTPGVGTRFTATLPLHPSLL